MHKQDEEEGNEKVMRIPEELKLEALDVVVGGRVQEMHDQDQNTACEKGRV